MPVTVGVCGIKVDPVATKLPIDIPQEQSIKLRYDINDINEVPQIKRIHEGSVDVEYPVERPEIVNFIELFESQFAYHNRENRLDDRQINEAIYDLTKHYFNLEDLELPDDPTHEARVRSLILKQVRGIKSTKKLIEYLKNNPSTSKLFGFESNNIKLSTSTLSRVRQGFLETEAAKCSIDRIQRALYRNGILFEKLSKVYNSTQAIPQDTKLASHLRYQSLINWCNLLLQVMTKNISFDRSSNITHSVRQVIASLAVRALGKSKNQSMRLGRLGYKDDIMTSTRINQMISENICQRNFFRSKEKIETIGHDMNRNLLKFADEELSFFESPVDVAFDSTWISLDDTEPEEISGAMGNVELEGDGGIQFVTGVTTTPMSRFALGAKLSTDKSKLPQFVRELLVLLGKVSDIGWLLADREFDNPESVELFRYWAEDDWIIRLRKNKNLISDDEQTELKKNGKSPVEFGGTNVNAFGDPMPKKETNRLQTGDDGSFIVLSGKPLDEISPSKLSKKYSKRWGVETGIRQLKHDFSYTQTNMDALENLFMLNLSSAFYNIWKIISQSLSPLFGLPLQPKYYEVLKAIADSTFTISQPLNLDI